MLDNSYSDADLLAYFDETLPIDRMTALESDLRQSPELRRRTALLSRRRDQGEHSVGEVWRRWRLSCPDRTELGSYLLGALDPQREDYITFHIQTVGCRFCEANLRDLEQTRSGLPEVERRRRKFFASSAGMMRTLHPESDAFGPGG